MQIHVVNQGDTLYQIADLYGTTPTALIDANELDTPNNLVPGQSLVIPIVGQFYFVQPGDSLFSISQQFGMTADQLAQINNIPLEGVLAVGTRLYIPEQTKPDITSNAYIEPLGGEVSQTLINSAEKTTPYLTYLAPFSYQVNRDGTLSAPPLDNFVQIAGNQNTALMLVITNLEEGEFSRELGHIILTVQAVQNTLLDSIVNVAQEIGFSDVHFDFEFLPPEDREAYNNFLRKAKQRLSEEGLMLSTALAPKTSAEQTGEWYEAHDYATHGEIADFVVLMTYEWGYSYGPPRAVSPINEVRKVVDFALSVMPPEKILLGQNLYGYDWTLPFTEGGDPAEALSPQQAIARARQQNVSIEYDTTAQAPFYTYTDSQGANHEVWFEDARSIQAKFDMIKELNLLGISYWKLGLAFPQNWLLLQDNFTITKLD
ncbi:spore germination protein [Lentibacillus persicus]|uniref:Spore germination protein n=1 Tax=Lentibacillus persicus TaxID=640948 RepID=A0A1I1UMK8_9BACI|nr:glycoside hydrolase family 18 protein [Lentibacillus persicus]SFD72026.1 spore germination protein [Lentibacillus persicus]